MKYILGTLVISLLLTSCIKRDEINVNETCTSGCATINIHVATGDSSASPLSNTYVELQWSDIKPEFPGYRRLIATGNTNSNGNITFSFKARENELKKGSFSISAKNTSEYIPSDKIFYGVTRFDTTLNTNIHLPSKAFLKLIFKNFYPVSNNDYFETQPVYNDYGSVDLPVTLTNINVDYLNPFFYGSQKPFDKQEFTGTTAGNQFTYFNIVKKKNGIKTIFKDSIYIAKGDSKIYEVDFK